MANLESNPSFIRPASTPKDQTEYKEDEKKAKQTNEDLAAPWQALIPIEAVVIPFFFDDLTLGPALVVALAASFGGGGWSEGAGEATGRGSPGVTAIRRVRRTLHGAVEGRCGLHGRRFIAIVGVSGRALHEVNRSLWGSGRRWCQARHIRVRLSVHHLLLSQSSVFWWMDDR